MPLKKALVFYFLAAYKSELLTRLENKKPETIVSGFLLRRKRDLYFLFYAFNNKDSAILNSRVSILNLKKSNFF